jgi:hypothetical protein
LDYCVRSTKVAKVQNVALHTGNARKSWGGLI